MNRSKFTIFPLVALSAASPHFGIEPHCTEPGTALDPTTTMMSTAPATSASSIAWVVRYSSMG